jgi:hypothetical protein
MPTNVFLSVGRTFTPEQERFVSEFEQYLRANGLTPQTVGRTYIKNQQPLRSVAECMRDCSGAAVLAFERTHVASGVEKRGSAQAVVLAEVNLPTVWNRAAEEFDVGKMSVGQLLGRLKAGQLWSVVTALFAAIAGALAIGYRIGLWSAARP